MKWSSLFTLSASLAAATSVMVSLLNPEILPFIIKHNGDITISAGFAALSASAYAAFVSLYISRRREQRLRQRRIFIIYSNHDREVAVKIVHHLRSSGYNPWFDVDEVAPGQKWTQAIMNGIAESAVALCLVSENLSENKFVSEELKAAMSVMRSRDESFSPIIPVRLDDSVMPQELSDVRWVDIRDKDGLEKLEKGLKRVLGQPKIRKGSQTSTWATLIKVLPFPVQLNRACHSNWIVLVSLTHKHL